MVASVAAQNVGKLTVSTTGLDMSACSVYHQSTCTGTRTSSNYDSDCGCMVETSENYDYDCSYTSYSGFPVTMQPLNLSFVDGSAQTYSNKSIAMDSNSSNFTISIIGVDDNENNSYSQNTILFSDAIMPGWTGAVGNCFGTFTFSDFVPIFTLNSAYSSECVNGLTKLSNYPSNKGSNGVVVAKYANWQFSLDQGATWVNFAPAYNQLDGVEFKIYDLLTASGVNPIPYINTAIHFRLGDATKLNGTEGSFSATPIVINFVTCEPIAKNINFKNAKCVGTTSGQSEIRVEFNRNFNNDETVKSLTIADILTPNQIIASTNNNVFRQDVNSFILTGPNLFLDDNHTYQVVSQCKIQSFLEPVVTNNLIYYSEPDNGRIRMNYDTTTDANGVGTGIRTLLVANPSQILVEGTSTNSTKIGTTANGRITLSVSGGKPICTDSSYHYSWTKDNNPIIITNLQALGEGTYKVVVKDKYGCSAEKTFTIIEPDPIQVTLNPAINIICNGRNTGSLSVNAVTGGYGNYNYKWFKIGDTNEYGSTNVATGLTAGTYYVEVTDAANNEKNSAEIILGENPKITTTLPNPVPHVFCKGDAINYSLNIFGGSGTYIVNWAMNGSSILINNTLTAGTNNYISTINEKAGSYDYLIIDSLDLNCSISGTITIYEPTDALTILITRKVSATTNNPNGGEIEVTPAGGILPNQTGLYHYVWTKTGDANFISTDSNLITGLQNGIYQVIVTSPSGCISPPREIIIAPLVVTIPSSRIDCFGASTGTLQANADGGTLYTINSKYTYAWFKRENNTDVVLTSQNVIINDPTKITNLGIGLYRVYVTDDALVQTFFDYDLKQNGKIVVTSNKTDVKCKGDSTGTISLTISGGSTTDNDGIEKGYTVNWSDDSNINGATRSGLKKGTYSYTITDALGCTFIPINITDTDIVISEPTTKVTFTQSKIQPTSAIANDGKITITAVGGTGAYRYLLTNDDDITTTYTSNIIESLPNGTYSVNVQDANGCLSLQEIVILQALTITNISKVNVKCYDGADGSIEVKGEGGNPFAGNTYNFQWYELISSALTQNILDGQTSASIVGLKKGKYRVIITDNNSTPNIVSKDYEINEPLIPISIKFESQKEVSCFLGSDGEIHIEIEGGTPDANGGYTFEWNKPGTLLNTANSSTNSGLIPGDYNVTVTDLYAACAKVFSFTITQPAEALTITPPTTAIPQITNLTGYQTQNGKIAITVTGGTPIYTYAWYEGFKADWTAAILPIPNNNAATISNLKMGDYYVRVTDAKLCVVDQDFNITQPAELKITEPIRTVNTPILCFGSKTAEFTTTITGGVPQFNSSAPYTIIWFNTTTNIEYTNTQSTTNGITTSKASNLGAGNYVITITDQYNNVLSGTNTFSISQPDLLAFTATATNATCKSLSNGAIRLNITGGTGIKTIICNPQLGTINPDNSISGLPSGNYNIFVQDANGCTTGLQTITIGEPLLNLAFIGNVIPTPTTGNGKSDGSITVNIAGGTSPYIYIWNNIGTVSNTANTSTNASLVAGIYSLTVTDAQGCSISDSFTVEEPTKPILTETHLQAKCNGLSGSLLAKANGGAGFNQNQIDRIYTYTLKNIATNNVVTISGNVANFTNIIDGDYTVTATDSGGIVSNTINVQFQQPIPIVTSIVSQQPVLCYGENQGAITIIAAGGTPFVNNTYNYIWKKFNNARNQYEGIIPNPNTTSISNLYAGTYAVEVQDANYNSQNPASCVGILSGIVIESPTNLMFVYSSMTPLQPTGANTTDGVIHVVMSGGQGAYTYLCTRGSENGAVVLLTTTTDLIIDIPNLNKDIYYIKVTDATGCPKTTFYDFTSQENLTVSLTASPEVVCKGGSKTLTSIARGGIGGNNYKWYKNNLLILGETNPILPNAGAGVYYVEIMSGIVLQKSNEITVVEYDQVEFTTSSQPANCTGDANGKITINASGGNGSYEYRCYQNTIPLNFTPFANASETIITNLLAGDYTIEVRDTKGCTTIYFTKIETVQQPSFPLNIASIIKTPTIGFGLANGGSISITPQGGNGGYTYEWFKEDNSAINQTSPTATNLFAGKYYVIVKDSKQCSITSDLIEVLQPPLLVASIQNLNVILCNGNATASIKASAIGGFLNSGENYTYKWFAFGTTQPVLGTNAILQNLRAGDSYYVVATDSNQINATSLAITIQEPSAINNFLTADYTLCGDGKDWTIAANPTGGTAPYTYIWNTNETTQTINVVAGRYSVKVIDSNGCSIDKEIVVIVPAHLDATAVIKIPTCYEGDDARIVITPIDGTAPYTYLWSTGETSNILSNVVAREYSVDIRDARGCMINRKYTINNPPKDVINIGEDVTLCRGQSLTINATIIDDNAIYTWTADNGFTSNNPIITVANAGTYSLTVINNLGCRATDAINIFIDNIDISAEFAVSSQVFVNEKIVIVDISNPQPDSLEWVLPLSANVTVRNKDFAELSFSTAGEYELKLNTKRGNCTAFQTKKILVVEGEYIDPELVAGAQNFDLKIFPNPSDGIFTIDVKLESVMPVKIKLFNLINNTIIDAKEDHGKVEYSFNFNLNNLTSGVYYVLFESKQGNKLRKIIIR